MNDIVIRPERYRQFGAAEGSVFCLITNSELKDKIKLERAGEYSDYLVYYSDEEGQIESLLKNTLPEHAHVLVVSPLCFFRSPDQECIGSRRKLIAMACNSTPTPIKDVIHFLRMIENTRPDVQQRFVDRFFDVGPRIKHMVIRDENCGTEAIFRHLRDDYEWNIQAGYLDWGEQQISPSGEISVLPADIWEFSDTLKLDIEGEITLCGLPILHSGEVSFLRRDQKHIFNELKAVHTTPIIAQVENGVITGLRAVERKGESAVRILQSLFDVDSRYRTIWELGFAVNTTLELIWANRAMNEVYGASNGCLHFGLGLTPYTQYHLDIICPGTTIYDEQGNVFFGGEQVPQSATA